MNISLLTRQQLEIINRRTLKYPLQIAEKDYFLAVVMQIISKSSLGKTLVFKGGTALNHCFLDQYRFSEDLDFSSNEKNLSLDNVRDIFADIPFLAIKKDRLSEATVKIEKLQYTGPLLHPNSLKVEVDILQNVLLPPKTIKYQNVWGLDFKVRVMDVREICAEKIRAMSDRARYRDFYDLFWLEEIHNLDLNEIVSYISRKEIRKPISKTSILRNWNVVGTQKTAEMSQVYYSRKVDDDAIDKLIENLPLTEISSKTNNKI
jgi:predicted nucleotidyltransferase component of viral defense system